MQSKAVVIEWDEPDACYMLDLNKVARALTNTCPATLFKVTPMEVVERPPCVWTVGKINGVAEGWCRTGCGKWAAYQMHQLMGWIVCPFCGAPLVRKEASDATV